MAASPSPRVAIYARYSSTLQNDKSCADQIAQYRRRAVERGWQVVEVLSDEAVSGSNDRRPGWRKLQVAVKAREVDLVLADALDRLSRDAGDLSAFYKLCQFHGLPLHTLAEGDVNELHVGIKGMFSESLLKDIRQKTRRGLRGVVEQGRSAGGLAYGYRIALDAAGHIDKGELTIDEREAAIIRRIFTAYVEGISPKKIAAQLNAEGIPSPRGRGAGSGHWKANTIYGNAARGTGVLNNELYIGLRIWNRLEYRVNAVSNFPRIAEVKFPSSRNPGDRPVQ